MFSTFQCIVQLFAPYGLDKVLSPIQCLESPIFFNFLCVRNSCKAVSSDSIHL